MKITLPLSIILSVIYFISDSANSLMNKFSNIFFIIGLIHLFIGLFIVLRNGGAFRSIRYLGYKLNRQRNKDLGIDHPEDDKSISYYDFTEDRYSKQFKFSNYLIVSGLSLAAALAFALF